MASSHWSEMLATYLDAVEADIKKEFTDPRTAGDWGEPIEGIHGANGMPPANNRQLDLVDALKALAALRAELAAEYPDGARLALLMSAVELNRLRLPAMKANAHYQAMRRGATAPKAKRTADAKDRAVEIRARGEELRKSHPERLRLKTDLARALAKEFSTMSVDRIRRIL